MLTAGPEILKDSAEVTAFFKLRCETVLGGPGGNSATSPHKIFSQPKIKNTCYWKNDHNCWWFDENIVCYHRRNILSSLSCCTDAVSSVLMLLCNQPGGLIGISVSECPLFSQNDSIWHNNNFPGTIQTALSYDLWNGCLDLCSSQMNLICV